MARAGVKELAKVAAKRRGADGGNRTSSILLVLLVALVLVPSANFALFSGIPLDSGPEFLAALLLPPLLVSALARERWRRLVGGAGAWPARAVAVLAALALVAKFILFSSSAHAGFLACYRSLANTSVSNADLAARRPVRGCEHSYANPLARFGATRIDHTINFGTQGFQPADSSTVRGNPWNLDFFNSLRFNFYDDQPGAPYRNFLPFSVRWTGTVFDRESHKLAVVYVGEGSIQVAKRRLLLAPSYRAPVRRALSFPPGRHPIVIQYRFDRQVLQPRPLSGPYAQIAIQGADRTALRSAPPAIGWRSLAVFADALAGALLTVAGVALLTVLRVRILLAVGLAAITALAMRLSHGVGTLAIGLLESGLFLLAVWSVARRRWSTGIALLTAYTCLVAIELVRAHYDFSSLDDVSYRTAGDDFLTYESQAHETLAGSLRGGESIFVYSPAFRYLLAGGRALFGNGDPRLSLVVMVALTYSVFAFGVACVVGRQRSPGHGIWNWPAARRESVLKAGACAAVGASLLLVTSSTVVWMVRAPMSESPTWILVPVAMLLLLHAVGRYAFVVAALLAGVALTTRFDQGIGLVFMLFCGAAALWRRERPDARSFGLVVTAAVVVFAAIALLPAIHNVHYGGKFVVLPETPRIPVNFPLPPSRLIRVCCDSSVRETFLSQLRGVTVIRGGASVWFTVVVVLLQLLWLGSLVALGMNWRRSSAATRLVGALPLALLLPHLFLQVYVYYPRHVVVGYLVMGLAAAFVMSKLAGGDDRTAPLMAAESATK
jgi:hypothetical protein